MFSKTTTDHYAYKDKTNLPLTVLSADGATVIWKQWQLIKLQTNHAFEFVLPYAGQVRSLL